MAFDEPTREWVERVWGRQVARVVKVTAPWRDRGVVVSEGTAYARLEEWLGRLLV